MLNKDQICHLVGLGCFLLYFGLSSAASAQDWSLVKNVPEKDVEFQKALAKYKRAEYRAAFVNFESLTNTRDLHQRMTVSLLMTGKSLYHLERYVDAIPYFNKLIELFPRSSYLDDAHFARASCYYRLSDYSNAIKDLLWVADWSSASNLVAKSKNLASLIMRHKMSLSDLRAAIQMANGEHSAGLVTIELSKKEIQEGSTEKAVSYLKAYQKNYNSKIYAASVDKLLKDAKRAENRPVKVGVILPLTGYFAEEGMGILRGIRFGLMQTQNSSNFAIELAIRDSESNMIKAIHGIKYLIRKEKVRAIIGELESEVTAGIGALAAIEGIPVLGPAATENDVASVGETVFQMNSNLERKGEAIAQYAYNELGLRTFATLAPADEYGQQLTDSFAATIDALGGRIIAQSWYYGEPQDLSRQFKAIRDAAFQFDSTNVQLLIREAKERGDKLDEEDISVNSIDGLFFPIYSDHIKFVAPQFAFSNINTQILGGEYWDDLEILKTAQIEPYINGAIFVSDYFPDESSGAFITFRNEFRIKMKRNPERWEVFGYDAFNLIAKMVEEGASTGRKISRKLSSLSNYQGIKGMISFKSNNRVNKEVNFLQFLQGKIIKHQLLR
ncbi:MAG: penicillin-binding protein activator [bacterium]